jgi:opacity protein-like surface antigen
MPALFLILLSYLMNIYRLYQWKNLCLILIMPAIFLVCSPARAQHTNQELRLNIYQSDDTNKRTHKGAFNATSLGVEYQHRLADHLNGVIGIRFLQDIETKGNHAQKASKKIKQYSNSYLIFDAGISLIPFVINDHFEIRISPGASLSHHNSVNVAQAVSFENRLPTLTRNVYQSQWLIGGFLNVGFDYIFTSNWLIELRVQYSKYNGEDGIFDIGLSLGRKF